MKVYEDEPYVCPQTGVTITSDNVPNGVVEAAAATYGYMYEYNKKE